MRLYLDQMFQLELADMLRSQGYDVLRATEAGQAVADDAAILQRCIDDQRTLVTMDEHFGNWAVLPLAVHPGVIRIKCHPSTTDNTVKLLLPFLASHEQVQFENHLVILSPRLVRWIKTGP